MASEERERGAVGVVVAPKQAGALPQLGGLLVAAMVARKKAAGAKTAPFNRRTGGLATRGAGHPRADRKSRVDPAG
jgi:hypothetical protein